MPLESGVEDLDLRVYFTDGDLYTSDTDESALCAVEFTPMYDREMKIKTNIYDSTSSTYPYDITLLVFYK